MRLYDVRGRLVYRNVKPYLIKWEEKSRSNLQFTVKQFLRPHWQKYVIYEEFPVYGSKLKVDFINGTKKIAIEVQGKQHTDYNKFFHGNRIGFYRSIQRDVKKFQWLEKNGFQFIELIEEDLIKLSPEFILEKFGVYLV